MQPLTKIWCCMSLKNNRHNHRGFTLPEILMGAVIFGFVSIVAVTTYVTLNQMWKNDLTLNELSHNANIAVEKMFRGRPANTGLYAAQSVGSPLLGASGDSVNYTDMNGVPRRFYYSGGSIYSESGSLIAADVASVTFYNINHTVRIYLVMHKYVVNKEIRFSMETLVSPRN